MRVLLAEDNARLATLIAEGLTEDGFTLDCFVTLAEAKEAALLVGYDLILLDLGMPDGDGINFIKDLRRQQMMTPVLVITARDGLGDRIHGLDSGADDYLVKPFELPELAARCRALLRRPGACLGVTLKVANVEFESIGRGVRISGKPMRLSPRECDLLERLMRRTNHVVAKESLEEALYSLETQVTPNALEAAVSRLRRRLSTSHADVIIHTAHGIGYMLAEKQKTESVPSEEKQS